MKKAAWILALVAGLLVPSGVAQTKPQGDISEADAIAREKSLFEADTKHDMDKLKEIFADEFVDLARDGTSINKQQILDEIPKIHMGKASQTNWRVHPLGKSAYSITYDSDATFTDDKGKEQHSHNTLNSVWFQRKGKWQMLLHCRGEVLK